MIPGDIDLTENLDFRKVKKKEIPQLPASWNGKDKLNTLNIDNSYITSLSTSSNYTFTYRYNEYTEYNYWTIEDVDNYLNVTIDTNDIITTSTWTYDSYQYFDTYTTELTTTSSSNKLRLESKSNKSKKDIFGNIIKEPEPIPEIPWKEKRKYNYDVPIPWKRRSKQWIKYDSEPAIPWDTDDDWGWNNYDKPNLSRPYDRAKHLISWLFGKSRTFIERYFDTEDEKVDLSYLTNMSWIRVHDAVIDSI